MSLQSFLEAGGLNSVQGLIVNGGIDVFLQNNRLTVLGEGILRAKMTEKGYDRHGLTDAEYRSAFQTAARSVNQARAVNRGGFGSQDPARIPSYPLQENRDQITYTVKVTVRHPDGTSSDVIVDVLSDRPLGRAEISVESLRSVEESLNIRSDPKGGAGGQSVVTGTTVISVYSGTVMPP